MKQAVGLGRSNGAVSSKEKLLAFQENLGEFGPEMARKFASNRAERRLIERAERKAAKKGAAK